MPYFIYEDSRRAGPFTLEELKLRTLFFSTLIWKEGLEDWTEASSLEELRGFCLPSPPSHKNTYKPSNTPAPSSSAERIGFGIGRRIGLLGLILILLVGAIYFYNQSSSRHSVILTSTSPSVDMEHANPAEFLAISGTYHPNFWGNKEEIDGTVRNNASHTNYKDVHVKVVLYSQTHTIISQQEFILYQYFPYGSTQNFKLTVDKPAVAATCGLVATGATYY